MQLILSLVGLIALAVWLVDVLLQVYEWQARIHIGRWTDRESWHDALEKKARKWILCTPKIPKSDNQRLVLLDIMKGDYWTSTIQSWQLGALIMGLEKQDVEKCLKHGIRFEVNNINVDHVFLAYALFSKGLLSEENMQIVDSFLSKYVEKKMSIPYREVNKKIHFVDTLGLACPYLYARGHCDLVNKMISDIEKVSLDGVLPPHAFLLDRMKPLGLFDWSRGLGWYIIALLFTNEKGERNNQIIRLADYLLSFEKPCGGYGWMIMDDGACVESSGTSIIGLLNVSAYKITGNEAYKATAERIEMFLMHSTRRDGAVDYAQGDTKGLGRYSTRFSIMPFVQGMSLMLCNELRKIE